MAAIIPPHRHHQLHHAHHPHPWVHDAVTILLVILGALLLIALMAGSYAFKRNLPELPSPPGFQAGSGLVP